MLTTKDKNRFIFDDLTQKSQLPTIVKGENGCKQTNSDYLVFTSSSSNSTFYCVILRKNKESTCVRNSVNSSLLDELRESLQELKFFKKNWDGYGASSFKKEVVSNAFHLLKLIFAKELLSEKINDIFIEPEINVVISFNIDYKNKLSKSTSISIGKNKISSYSKYTKHNNSGLMFDLESRELDFLINQLNNATMGIYSYKYAN